MPYRAPVSRGSLSLPRRRSAGMSCKSQIAVQTSLGSVPLASESRAEALRPASSKDEAMILAFAEPNSSSSNAQNSDCFIVVLAVVQAKLTPRNPYLGYFAACAPGSEEHTAELQSRFTLVCRL